MGARDRAEIRAGPPAARLAAGEQPGPPMATFWLGMAGALAAFSATFRGPRPRFWQRMTFTGLGLGAFALLADGRLLHERLRPWHVPAGLGIAAALYGIFRAGDRFARRFVPGGDRQIREIYALRTLRPAPEITARLATVVGPAEELFWRGLVQDALTRRYGRWRGAALAAVCYGGVHVTTGNFTLLGAAGVAGATWSALSAARVPLGALVVSHIAWDIWIFLVQPTGEIEPLAQPA